MSDSVVDEFRERAEKAENEIKRLKQRIIMLESRLDAQDKVKEEEKSQTIDTISRDEKEEKEQTEVILDPTLAKNEYPAAELAKCKSLMAKHLTKDLFEKLKNLKTKTGFMLKNAINTGVKNKQSLMGIHAGDIESYTLFNDIFSLVNEDYHNTKTFHKGIKSSFSVDSEEKSEINVGDIPNFKNIKSTRIRVARNIDGFPLAPAQTTVDFKLAIEQLMIKVFATLQSDNELKGTYYPLYGMDEKVRQKFIDDHFLFSGNDDPMQTDSGYHLWFPKGRGIYLNESKTFIVWLNEGDHLRLISMQKGNNVKSVFDRLKKAVLAIESGIKQCSNGKNDGFLFDSTYGNVTCCPTNLGTGLRASVHINMPKLAKQGLDKLNDIAIKYKMQIRGLYGEHSEIEEDAVVDISNKFRMGYSELTLVQFMCDGVNELNKMEQSPTDEKEEKEQTEIVLNATLAKNEYPSEELKKCKGLMAKYLTKDLFEKLKDLKTKNNFMLKNAVNTGVKNPQSLVGIHAGDIESYSLFKDIFGVVIEDYHQTKTYHKGIKSSFSSDSEEKADINVGDIPNFKNIKSTRIRVARNIDGFPLAPAQTTVDIKLEIEQLMIKVFATLQSDNELKGTYYPLYGMDEKVRQKFIDDHFLFSGNDDPMQTDSGYHLWFPKGRGIYLNESKTFIVWLNEGDHLRLISMQKGNNVKGVFDTLKKAVLAFEAGIRKCSEGKSNGFLCDDTYGNVTCCPTNLGTGLRASVHINMPNLAKQGLDKLNDIAIKYKMQIRGLYGEHSEIEEDAVVDISNKFRMGYSELTLVQFMCDGVNELNKMEQSQK